MVEHRPLSVIVDGAVLATGSRFSGLGRYVHQLLDGLRAVEGIHARALVSAGAATPGEVPRILVPDRRLPQRFADAEHRFHLRRALRKEPSDVFHGPAIDVPKRVDRAWVQTVHDVIPLLVDDPLYVSQRPAWQERLRRLESADVVLTGSEATADDIGRLVPSVSDRIRVVHYGTELAVETTPPARVGPPFILVVSGFMPHKGLAEAFEVIARIADRGHEHRLRYIGRIDPALRYRFEALLGAARRPDLVDVVGYVEDDVLRLAYASAEVALVPSRREGFGLPALEAMAAGAPVVAFDNSSLPEVVGDGGLLVPDGEVGSMTEAVLTLIEDGSKRASLVGAGRRRAAAFSWQRCAHETAAVYRAAAG